MMGLQPVPNRQSLERESTVIDVVLQTIAQSVLASTRAFG